MKTKQKPKPVEDKTEIINAAIGDVELYYQYDFPSYVKIFFIKDDGTHERFGEYFASIKFSRNSYDNMHKNFGMAMADLLEFLECSVIDGIKISEILRTPVRLKIDRIKTESGKEIIKVLSVGHITRDKWIVADKHCLQ